MSKQQSFLIKLDFLDDGSGIDDFCFAPDHIVEGVPVFVVRMTDDEELLDALGTLLKKSGQPVRIPRSLEEG